MDVISKGVRPSEDTEVHLPTNKGEDEGGYLTKLCPSVEAPSHRRWMPEKECFGCSPLNQDKPSLLSLGGVQPVLVLTRIKNGVAGELADPGARERARGGEDIVSKSLEYVHCALSFNASARISQNLIRWERPALGWLKLNTDGLALEQLGVAGGGGVLRDERGDWVIGFARNIGRASSFTAELWALRDGLSICLVENFLKVEVEMDAKILVNMLTDSSNVNVAICPLVDDCRHLASQLLQVRFKHCYREANRCADSLAWVGSQQSPDFLLFNSPPVGVELVFNLDFNGWYYNRCCPDVSP
ncbi:hypothetical protein SO802_017647 [Lithocarpus litseifolius]|uniref:RNase H type-1 domain-containing protein n=1 Tax=Lithocarpus litseifolius TaxID=425828 RepID=A0AAW2CMY2_9ROSI